MKIKHSYRIAIQTKYIGPTNYRWSRVKAFGPDGQTLTLDWDDALNMEENHAEAVKALCKKFEWGGTWTLGGTKIGYCAVQTN